MTEQRVIFEDRETGRIRPARAPEPGRPAQPPTLTSREDLEAFIAELREAADRVWPERNAQ